MEKDLVIRFNNQKENAIKDAIDPNMQGLEFKMKYIEAQNYEKLDGYVSYLYQYYLLLTSKEDYAKENGLESSDSEVLKKHFIEQFGTDKNIFNSLLNDRISKRDKTVYNSLQSSKKASFLKQVEYLKNLIKDKEDVRITMHLDLPSICGLESLIGKQKYSLSELEVIKEKLEETVDFLKHTYGIFENYSPESYMNMKKDSNYNIVDKVYFCTHSFDIMGDGEFNRIKKWVNLNYPLHKKLKLKSKISKKSREELYTLTYTFIDVSKELFSIIEDYIVSIYKKLLPQLNESLNDKIDILYLSKNYDNMRREICEFIIKINEQIDLINAAIKGVNYQRDSINMKICKALVYIKDNYFIEFTSDSDVLSFDPYETYGKVHLSMLAKDVDRMVSDDIINTYGKLADELVYRLIPLK